jgi:hypothetical protein
VTKDEARMTVRMPRELYEAAQAKAKAEDVTISQLVRWYLRAWIQGDTPRILPHSPPEHGDRDT